jgi:hypothetical protein
LATKQIEVPIALCMINRNKNRAVVAKRRSWLRLTAADCE